MSATLNLRPVISKTTNWKQVDLGAANLAAVRAYFSSHLCATNIECSIALGISVFAVGRHVRTIRAEWKPRP